MARPKVVTQSCTCSRTYHSPPCAATPHLDSRCWGQSRLHAAAVPYHEQIGRKRQEVTASEFSRTKPTYGRVEEYLTPGKGYNKLSLLLPTNSS